MLIVRHDLKLGFYSGARRYISGAVAFLLLTVSAASAQDWVTLPTLSVVGAYETNPDLEPGAGDSNTTYRINPSIISRLELPTSAVELSGSVTFTRSRNETVQEDSEQYRFGGSYEKDFETSVASVDADVSFEEFANSEFDDDQALSAVDATQSNEDDTILSNKLRFQLNNELSETDALTSSLDLTHTEFSDEARTDFADIRGDARLDHDYSETTTLSAVLGLQYFDPAGETAVKVLRGAGGYAYEFGDNHSLSILGGLAISSDRTSFTADASYFQPFKDFDFAASVSNDVQADDDGELNETARADFVVTNPISEFTNLQTSLGLTKTETTNAILLNSLLSYDYSDTLRTSFSASYRYSENVGGENKTETTQVVLAPSVTWTVYEELDAIFRYDEINERDQDDQRANSRRGTLTLNYNLPPL